MSDLIARVRFARRWNNYYPGDIAVFPLDTAETLVRQRFADGLAPPVSAESKPGAPVESTPTRQGPAQMVRK